MLEMVVFPILRQISQKDNSMISIRRENLDFEISMYFLPQNSGGSSPSNRLTLLTDNSL